MRFILAFRALFFVVVVPGTVAGYIPFAILRRTNEFLLPRANISTIAAFALTLAGAFALFRCVWDFFSAGKGTLAPVDPPKHLVVQGPYRFTRNPMYNGVLAILLGEASLFSSLAMAKYALLILLMFHLVVVLYEEPDLAARFGDSYADYRRHVPRWGFTVRPYVAR